MADWGEYVPVADRRAQARRQAAKLRQGGRDVQPVEIEGRLIARSFWGKRWCEHLESFSDYSNRLPRGRTYVRNGAVCHLEISHGRVAALVSGTDLYEVRVEISDLPADLWTAIKRECSGRVSSMLELLRGQLSDHVMAIVTDRATGLFPQPREIKLDCSCPDSARMCKHVAAVMYGVGSRLDSEPELLFRLRGVDPMELVSAPVSLPAGATDNSDILADDRLADIFGIEFADETDQDLSASEEP